MATVTRKFRDDFETWAAHKVAKGEFTPAEIEGLRDMLRQDLAPGPDQLRAGVTVILAAGLEIPAAIDDHEERYRLWGNFFAAEAEAIRNQAADGARLNDTPPKAPRPGPAQTLFNPKER